MTFAPIHRNSLQGSFARLIKCRRGSVAILFAFMLVPAALLVGLVTDFANLQATRARFQQAADAAVLAAITSDSTSTAARRDIANSVFLANLSPGDRDLVDRITIDGQTSGSSAGFTLSYAYRQKFRFGEFAGVPGLLVDGSARAEVGLSGFYEIELWLDYSASMLVGVDQAARTRLKELSANDPFGSSCAFACHDRIFPNDPNSISKYQRAVDAGVQLRGNVMLATAKDIISRVLQTNPGKVKFALHGLGLQYRRLTDKVDDVQVLNSALDNLLNDFTDISQIDQSMFDAERQTAPGGDGLTPDNPRRMVVILTDGLQFDRLAWPGSIDTQNCDRLKSKNITVSMIHLPYIDLTGDPDFDIKADLGQVPRDPQVVTPALRRCASDGFYFEALDAPAIRAAFDAAIERLAQTAKLVQ